FLNNYYNRQPKYRRNLLKLGRETLFEWQNFPPKAESSRRLPKRSLPDFQTTDPIPGRIHCRKPQKNQDFPPGFWYGLGYI
ncbi:hypothetical protein, partial [uncultured Rhizobium sp.]|uniref:hypothetical protein n=1 Tax=uncultured Rhizobium sp. TaxID=155567 RepID=UPI00261AA542